MVRHVHLYSLGIRKSCNLEVDEGFKNTFEYIRIDQKTT